MSTGTKPGVHTAGGGGRRPGSPSRGCGRVTAWEGATSATSVGAAARTASLTEGGRAGSGAVRGRAAEGRAARTEPSARAAPRAGRGRVSVGESGRAGAPRGVQGAPGRRPGTTARRRGETEAPRGPRAPRPRGWPPGLRGGRERRPGGCGEAGRAAGVCRNRSSEPLRLTPPAHRLPSGRKGRDFLSFR